MNIKYIVSNLSTKANLIIKKDQWFFLFSFFVFLKIICFIYLFIYLFIIYLFNDALDKKI